MAEAATQRGVVKVGSPVLAVRAHFRVADALAVLDGPVHASIARLWDAHTLTLFGVVTLIF